LITSEAGNALLPSNSGDHVCELIAPVRVRLLPEPASVRRARDIVREHVCPLQDEAARETAALLVSELVTNAVKHGVPPIELAVLCGPEHVLQVRVRDAGNGLPTPVVAQAGEEGGRGLALTQLLSDDWGVDPDHLGKTVWFTLARAG
jgi:anti-sigma regulatory factor (Ser/Thr protein kinase)